MMDTRSHTPSSILDLGPARVSELPEMMPFHLWRGRSGQRYIVAIHKGELEPAQNSVVLLVKARDGVREVCGTLSFGAVDGQAHERLQAAAAAAGADELHVHLLAQTEPQRAAMVRDLTPRQQPSPATA